MAPAHGNLPQYPPTSSFVRECLERIPHRTAGIALDIPCGLGRHTLLLAKYGMFVVAADLDDQCLRAVSQTNRIGESVAPIRLNANHVLPFRLEAFDLVTVVHALSLKVLANAMPTVRAGGHLIFETYGAQGENWRSLPRPREVSETFSTRFDPVLYRERMVRGQSSAVTVKALFRRI
jgi:SAM-dependent methyltransferase